MSAVGKMPRLTDYYSLLEVHAAKLQHPADTRGYYKNIFRNVMIGNQLVTTKNI